jgi:LmbE family N-acetylglucosaminyl deacetylase
MVADSKTGARLDLLAFGAHPDDVEIGMAGSVARHVAEGLRVGLCDLTRGELGSNGTPEDRVAEAEAARAVLGAVARENLALPDGGLRPHDAGQLRLVADCIRRWRPRTIAVPYWRDRHPDHVDASHLITRAAFKSGLRRYPGSPDKALAAAGAATAAVAAAGGLSSGVSGGLSVGLPGGAPGKTRGGPPSEAPDDREPWRPDWIVYYFINDAATPSFVIDVTAHYARKREALACHRTQFAPAGDAATGTRLTTPLFQQLIESRDAQFGALSGVAFAEGFVVRQTLVRPHLLKAWPGRP